jgi:hypothetical protein
MDAFVNNLFLGDGKGYGMRNGLGLAGSMDGFNDGAAIVGADPVLDQFVRGGVLEGVHGYKRAIVLNDLGDSAGFSVDFKYGLLGVF